MLNVETPMTTCINNSSPRNAINWVAIQCDYRAGVKPLRLIAEEHGITHGAINKRAKRDGWSRDLAPKIRAAADEKISKAVVSAAVSTETKITEKLTVEIEATVQARIRLAQRADIASARGMAMSLLTELEHQTVNQDLYGRLRELVITGAADEGVDPERIRKLTEAFDRAMSLSSRVKTMKDLVDTLRILIDKEREAFKLDDIEEERPEDPVFVLRRFFAGLHESGACRLKIAPPRVNPMSA